MRIFILEDDTQERIPVFKAKLSEHELVFAETAQEAIKILEKQEFDLIFLDHDLGGQQMMSACEENTGSEVVRFMQTLHYGPGRQWPTTIIHSLNVGCAKSMEQSLLRMQMSVHRIPWGNLKERLEQPGFIS